MGINMEYKDQKLPENTHDKQYGDMQNYLFLLKFMLIWH